MVKYSFSVCCDSSNNFYQQIDGSTTSFIFDWTLVPEGNYNLTWAYMSDDTTITLSPVMTLWADFNGVGQTFLANGTSASSKINFLGILRASGHGANTYYYADSTTNPPIRLQRPTNTIFTISLRNGLTTTAYATTVADQ